MFSLYFSFTSVSVDVIFTLLFHSRFPSYGDECSAVKSFEVIYHFIAFFGAKNIMKTGVSVVQRVWGKYPHWLARVGGR